MYKKVLHPKYQYAREDPEIRIPDTKVFLAKFSKSFIRLDDSCRIILFS